MNWLILIFAGLLEVGWAVGLKYTDGFTKPAPSIATVAAMAASFYCLSIAMRSLPLSVAYTVWVGIGMIGAVIFGVVFFREPLSVFKLVSLLLIITGILGLKLSSAG
jgi:quaternary ammonium compound-resistance protein SugE